VSIRHNICIYNLEMKLKVAIPEFEGKVAPRFETAAQFVIVSVDRSRKKSEELVSCRGGEGLDRIRILRDYAIDVLICNGIKSFYVNLLDTLKIDIIDKISLGVDEALDRFLKRRLHSSPREAAYDECSATVLHDDLLRWARRLFEKNGYKVYSCHDECMFPIDLIAEIECPVCHKMIRIAICCGAHIYRADQEIREFYHATSASFPARVYINSCPTGVRERCQTYNIQLISPDQEKNRHGNRSRYGIPILQRPVPGHEKAFGVPKTGSEGGWEL